MGCVAALCAPDSQKRLTRCCSSFEVATYQHKKLPKSQYYFNSRVEAYLDGYITYENMAMTKSLMFPRGTLLSGLVRIRNTSGRKKFVPVRAINSTLLGPTKNGPEGAQSLWIPV